MMQTFMSESDRAAVDAAYEPLCPTRDRLQKKYPGLAGRIWCLTQMRRRSGANAAFPAPRTRW